MPRICLCMIVKNEAHIVGEALEKLAPLIDFWVICDTGSVDGTQELIKSFFADKGIPGFLIEDPWRNDFAYSRSVVVNAVPKKCEFIFMFDADDTITGELKFPKVMNADVYTVNIGEGDCNVHTYPRVIRNSLKWKYRCVRHEIPVSKFSHKIAHIGGDYVIQSRRLGSRNHDPKKYHNDAMVMIQAIPKEPDMERRYTYYVGQSFMDAKEYDQALQWYKKRIDLGGGNVEEVYLSYYYIADIYKWTNKPEDEVVRWYFAAWKYSPIRAEPLFRIAEYLEGRGKLEEAYKYSRMSTLLKVPNVSFLLEKRVYEYYRWLRHGLIAFYTKRYVEAMTAFEQALLGAQGGERGLVEKNILLTQQKINSDRQTLAFYTGYADFADEAYGSEIALVELARRLMSYYRVIIIGMVQPPQLPGCQFVGLSHLSQTSLHVDILIISRYINYFLYCSQIADRTYLWIHDCCLQPYFQRQILPENGKSLLLNNLDKINGIVTLTDWHCNYFKEAYRLDEKIRIIGNGIKHNLFTGKIGEKVPGRFIFTSCPTRGLINVLKMMEQIYAEFPYVSLHIYRDETKLTNEMWEIINRCSYITFCGRVSQDVLARAMEESEIWLYMTDFKETYCMSALEAMAAGCYCISYPTGGVKDVVGSRGVLVENDLEVLDAVRKALSDDEHRREVQKKSQNWAMAQTWDQRTSMWLDMFAEEETNNLDDWICITGYDSVGGDLCYGGRQNIKTLKQMARMMPDCVAFNDWGYFKKEITGMGGWKRMNITMYIRRDRYPQCLLLKLADRVDKISKYVINLPHRTDRREHMERSFPDAVIVEAVGKHSDLVKSYSKGCEEYNCYGKGMDYDRLAEFACLASHLKVLNAIARSGEYAVVLEDDVIIRDEFDFNVVVSNIVAAMKARKINLVMLCCASEEAYTHVEPHLHKGELNLCPIVKQTCWGTQGYVVSPEYAKHALRLYNKVFNRVNSDLLISHNRITAEVITRNSRGYFTYPPIIIEDINLQSDIGAKNKEHHMKLFKRWM